MSNILPILYKVINYLIIYEIINLLMLKISLFKIFIKEKRNPLLSLIPIYDFIIYFKIIKIPIWTLFFPGLNIIAIIVSPYRLAKQYQCRRYEWSLALIIPFYYYPYIAFSKLYNKDIKYKFNYYRSQKDIDSLEDKLNNLDTNTIIPKSINLQYGNNNKTTDFIDKMDYEDTKEYVEDEEVFKYKEINHEVKKSDTKYNITDDDLIDETLSDTFVEIIDYDNVDNSILNSIDKQTNETEIKLVDNKVDYTEAGPTDSAIAFGGENKIEDLQIAKKDEGKCPRCGSSLVGSMNNICPGCGASLKDIIK